MGSHYDSIYREVGRIPMGCVATYGQIAKLIGMPRWARQVGYALAALPGGHMVPWHRVVNAKGEISSRAKPGCDELQRLLLEEEGVIFGTNDRISLPRFQWRPEPEG